MKEADLLIDMLLFSRSELVEDNAVEVFLRYGSLFLFFLGIKLQVVSG